MCFEQSSKTETDLASSSVTLILKIPQTIEIDFAHLFKDTKYLNLKNVRL